MYLTLKEYLDKTRYDTGITTDEMMYGIRKIQLDYIKKDIPGTGNLMVEMFKTLLQLQQEGEDKERKEEGMMDKKK